MPTQHNICSPPESHPTSATLPEQNILVPLVLPGFQILSQTITLEDRLEVTIISIADRAACPRCGRVSPKQHDRRLRRKRDVALGGHPVALILYKRRFRCLTCWRPFTESDHICGWRRRTTRRLRRLPGALGGQAYAHPIADVTAESGVGLRFVQACLVVVAQARLGKLGRTLDESAPLPTPRFLGIDEFARCKGQRYETILCDLEARQVLEMVAGCPQAEVCSLLERLAEPERVEAVSMDMSLDFWEAVRLCLQQARIVADHFHVVQHVGKALPQVLVAVPAVRRGERPSKGTVTSSYARRRTWSRRRTRTAPSSPSVFPIWGPRGGTRKPYGTGTLPANSTDAAAGLDAWIAGIEREGLAELIQALSAFRAWRAEILAFFVFLPTRISNGFVEGKNNRTKALMRQAYGYRNLRHLRLRILLEVA